MMAIGGGLTDPALTTPIGCQISLTVGSTTSASEMFKEEGIGETGL